MGASQEPVATQSPRSPQKERQPVLVRGTGALPGMVREYKTAGENMESFLDNATDSAVSLEENNQAEKVADLKQLVKNIIDLQEDCRIRAEVLAEIQTQISTGPGIADPRALFLEKYEAAFAAYLARPDPDRFKGRQAYDEFRRQVWEVRHEGEVLPDEGQVDEEADLIQGTQKLPTKCPLTKVWLEDPVEVPRCKHVFSRAAIMQMEVLQGLVECPVPACKTRFRKTDLLPRKDIVKHVERERRKLQQRAEDGEEEDEEDDEEFAKFR
ncbi:hypothetical protein DFJ74DRAFT_649419 [Hyaloraphidium curvatum]|nr:hypothetical protein DFJ74DRAFT_649419 [Hyaloraphidium curvatum]